MMSTCVHSSRAQILGVRVREALSNKLVDAAARLISFDRQETELSPVQVENMGTSITCHDIHMPLNF